MWTCFTLFLFVKYLNEKNQKNWKWKNVKKNKPKNISHLLVNYLPSFLIIISLLSSFKKKNVPVLFFSLLQGQIMSHTVTAQHSSAKVDGLRAATPYVVQVRARTVAGYGRYSNPMDFSTTSLNSTTTHTHTRALGSTGEAWRFPVTLPTNEGSGLTVVTANANWRLSQMKRPSFSLSSADVVCVCVKVTLRSRCRTSCLSSWARPPLVWW